MSDYDVTKLPFISISREGVKMLKKLDEGTLYDVMQHVLDYVLTGEDCDCQDTLSSVVCGMLIDTIDRKGRKAYNSIKNLPPSPKKKTEDPVPVSVFKPQPVQEPVTPDIPKEDLPEAVREKIIYYVSYHSNYNFKELQYNPDKFYERHKDTLAILSDNITKETGEEITKDILIKYLYNYFYDIGYFK